MGSLVTTLKAQLEEQGEYVLQANQRWFAVFDSKWKIRVEVARNHGREGPNLIVDRSKSEDPRDHYAIPYQIINNLLQAETLTHSQVNGSLRWNLTLKNGRLHVSHLAGSVAVQEFHGAPLIVEELEFMLPSEVPLGRLYREGAVRQVLVNAYERDRSARELCIAHFGRRCFVCQMTFAEAYGPAAEKIIHVHHLVAMSSIGEEYTVDPKEDLRPVCPNCHAVIHSRSPMYSIEEVKKLLRALPC